MIFYSFELTGYDIYVPGMLRRHTETNKMPEWLESGQITVTNVSMYKPGASGFQSEIMACKSW